MMPSPGHISARLLVQFVELARRHGLDVAAQCEEAGSLAAVATKLHMRPHTLQRRLREEGSSHEALLDGLRHDLARVCLEKRLSISAGSSPGHYRAHSGSAWRRGGRAVW